MTDLGKIAKFRALARNGLSDLRYLLKLAFQNGVTEVTHPELIRAAAHWRNTIERHADFKLGEFNDSALEALEWVTFWDLLSELSNYTYGHLTVKNCTPNDQRDPCPDAGK